MNWIEQALQGYSSSSHYKQPNRELASNPMAKRLYRLDTLAIHPPFIRLGMNH